MEAFSVCILLFCYSYFVSVFLQVAPISIGSPRISRSNSIGPPNEAACDLDGPSTVGSSVSSADRPKSMMRSGSFREPGDDGERWLLGVCVELLLLTELLLFQSTSKAKLLLSVALYRIQHLDVRHENRVEQHRLNGPGLQPT